MESVHVCWQLEVVMTHQSWMVVDLGFGDQGKGTIVDYLVRLLQAGAVVRYNGGSQAAHGVVGPNDEKHVFTQFGSGTLVPGVKTLVSQYMLFDPLVFENEADVLISKGVVNAFSMVVVNEQSLIITPIHIYINRMLELSRGDNRHGSCGKGVGQTVADAEVLGSLAVRARDLLNPVDLKRKLQLLWLMKVDQAEQLASLQPEDKELQQYLEQISDSGLVDNIIDAYQEILDKGLRVVDQNQFEHILCSSEHIVYEAAQGVLLDPDFGFLPYVTRTKTTLENAMDIETALAQDSTITKIGILRAYATRHGPGPFVTYDRTLTELLPDVDNGMNQWQRDFRVGWFDLVAACYALEVVGELDYLALTNVDRLYGLSTVKVASAYRYTGDRFDLLDKYFDWRRVGKSGLIYRIKAETIRNRQDQTNLTAILSACTPVYENQQGFVDREEADSYIQFLEKELSVPIKIVSVGPKATDKYTR